MISAVVNDPGEALRLSTTTAVVFRLSDLGLRATMVTRRGARRMRIHFAGIESAVHWTHSREAGG